ncbi:MAG: hypothetical protein AB7E47_10520 [Desulfovibrionaceae bacterium]
MERAINTASPLPGAMPGRKCGDRPLPRLPLARLMAAVVDTTAMTAASVLAVTATVAVAFAAFHPHLAATLFG